VATKLSGMAVASIGIGSLLAYAGVEGFSVLKATQNIIQGNKADTGQQPLSLLAPGSNIVQKGGQFLGIPVKGSGPSANRALGKKMCAAVGWTSQNGQWQAFDWIAEEESGWSSTVTNPNSSAAGIAQNIAGFGSGYESGNASQQIQWMIGYIQGRYGNPIAAKAFHVKNGWY
jgi:hypothetical protein